MVTPGEISIILSALKNHTVIEKNNLQALVGRQWETITEFEKTLSECVKQDFCSVSAEFLMLTDHGDKWLQENASDLTVEADIPSDDTVAEPQIKKPYNVAKLKMEPKPLSVFQALRKIEKNEIDLNPEFQRAFVWDIQKQSRLIESIIIKIPLPSFYIDATNKVSWVVVDGLQRLTTLYRYCRDESFSLQGLQFLTELNGLKFSQLPPEYKVAIEDDTQLMFYNLMPGTPPLAKYTIFSRVNTGGMQLTPQEIRHALNQGHATELLRSLAKSSAFLACTQGVVENLRMSDRELILRAIAFSCFGYKLYREYADLDSFLTYAMMEINNFSKEKLQQIEDRFLNSMKKNQTIFGIYAFRKFYYRGGRRSPLNKALFEVWSVGVEDYDLEFLETHRSVILERFISAMNSDYSFVKSISSSTASFSAVERRFITIEKILRGL